MKKFIILIVLLLTSSLLFAGMTVSGRPCPGSAATASCSTSTDEAIFDDTAIGGGADQALTLGAPWAGRQFTTATTKTITEYAIFVCDVNRTGSLVMSIYEDNAGSRGDIVPGTSVTISNTEISDCTTDEVQLFTLSVPKTNLASGTYWLVAELSESSFVIQYAASSGKRSYFQAASGYINGYTLKMGVWGCDE